MNSNGQIQRAEKTLADYKILILAGGQGTRLLSRVSSVPKPLAPVQEKVFLDYLLSSLYRQGIRHIDFSLQHKADQVIQWLENFKKPADLNWRYAIEPEPLGTGGALAFCRNYFNYHDDLFVCNGDTYLENGVDQLYNKLSDMNLMATSSVNDISQFGSVEADSHNWVTKFNEKSGQQKAGLVNAGLYLLKKEFLQSLPSGSFSLEKELFNSLISEKKLQSVPLKGLFIDIGTPDNYDKFIALIETKRVNESWD